MKNFLCKLFNIYPGEERNCIYFAILGFLWSFAITLGAKFADALFLINIGAESLPTVYIFAACGMIIPAVLLIKTVNRVSSYKIFLTIIGFDIAFYAGIYLYLTYYPAKDQEWLWYVLRVVGFQIKAITVTGYWTFLDQYHNMQDAKRLYVLFSSMAFLGLAATGTVMRSGLLDFEQVLLLILFLLFIAAFCIKQIVSRVHLAHDASAMVDSETDPSNRSIFGIAKEIVKSKFSLLVMANNFVIFMMCVTTEYNYLSYFDAHFDPTEHQATAGINIEDAALTLFLGKIIVAVGMANLFFGLFVYSRLARRYGLGMMLTYSPIVLIVAFTGWLFKDSMVFPIMGYFIVEGSLEVIDDVNFNLLLNAIPKKLKYKVRITIESFLEPSAMLLSGTLLSIAFIDTKILSLVLAMTALLIAFIIRKEYHHAIYRNLAASALHFERPFREWILSFSKTEFKEEEKAMQRILDHESSEKKLFALAALIGFDDSMTLPSILDNASKLSDEAKIRFLSMLGDSPFASHSEVSSRLLSWSKDPATPELKAALYYYLAKQGLLHPENMREFLHTPHLQLRAAAILTLKTTTPNLPNALAAEYRTIADKEIARLISSNNYLELMMGIQLLGEEKSIQHFQLLLPFLASPSLEIARHAMQALAKVTTPNCRKYAKTLLAHLRASNDIFFRKACLTAIGKLEDATLIHDIIAASLHFRQSERRLIEAMIRKIGLNAVPMLLATTRDHHMPDRCRALSGRILGHLALPHLHSSLHDIVQVEANRAYFYFSHYHSIQSKYPDKDLTLLVEALLTGYHSVMDFIIQLLCSAGEVEDADLLLRLYRNPDIRIRSQVVETLEKTCDRKIFLILRQLIEDVPPEEMLRTYYSRQADLMPLSELLEKMSLSASPVDQIAAVATMYQLKLPELENALKRQVHSHEEIFQHFAQELLAQ